jgi:hypothetical protein
LLSKARTFHRQDGRIFYVSAKQLATGALIGAGDCKSIQPIAARNGDIGYGQLHHFIASAIWDAGPLEKALLTEADRMVAALRPG